jgi:putative addiction module component (TIGR02574 family)
MNMDLSATLLQVKTLTIDDRIWLVQAIWDSIGAEPRQFDLTEAQKQELLCRLADHKVDTQSVVPWDYVKSQALSRAGIHE